MCNESGESGIKFGMAFVHLNLAGESGASLDGEAAVSGLKASRKEILSRFCAGRCDGNYRRHIGTPAVFQLFHHNQIFYRIIEQVIEIKISARYLTEPYSTIRKQLHT